MQTDDSAEIQDAGDVVACVVITVPLFVDPEEALLDQEDNMTNDACEVDALQRYNDKISMAQTGAQRIGFNFRC